MAALHDSKIANRYNQWWRIPLSNNSEEEAPAPTVSHCIDVAVFKLGVAVLEVEMAALGV